MPIINYRPIQTSDPLGSLIGGAQSATSFMDKLFASKKQQQLQDIKNTMLQGELQQQPERFEQEQFTNDLKNKLLEAQTQQSLARSRALSMPSEMGGRKLAGDQLSYLMGQNKSFVKDLYKKSGYNLSDDQAQNISDIYRKKIMLSQEVARPKLSESERSVLMGKDKQYVKDYYANAGYNISDDQAKDIADNSRRKSLPSNLQTLDAMTRQAEELFSPEQRDKMRRALDAKFASGKSWGGIAKGARNIDSLFRNNEKITLYNEVVNQDIPLLVGFMRKLEGVGASDKQVEKITKIFTSIYDAPNKESADKLLDNAFKLVDDISSANRKVLGMEPREPINTEDEFFQKNTQSQEVTQKPAPTQIIRELLKKKDSDYPLERMLFNQIAPTISTLSSSKKSVKNDIENLGDFIYGAGDSIGNFERNLLNLALPKSLQMGRAENTKYPDSYSSKAGEYAGDVLSFMAGGAPASLGLKAATSIPKLGKAATYLSKNKFTNSMLRRALGAGGYTAIQNPDDRIGGGILGALASGGIDTALGALPYSGKFLKNVVEKSKTSYLNNKLNDISSIVSDNLGDDWKDILQKRVEATRGTKASLGDVLEVTKLKRLYENHLGHLGKGSQGIKEKIRRDIVSDVDKVLKDWRTDSKGIETPIRGIDKAIEEGLSKNFSKQQEIKKKLYEKPSELIANENVYFELPETNKKYAQYAEDLDKNELIKGFKERSKVFRNLGKVFEPKKYKFADQFDGDYLGGGGIKNKPPDADQYYATSLGGRIKEKPDDEMNFKRFKGRLSSSGVALPQLRQIATDLDEASKIIGQKNEGYVAVRALHNALRTDIKNYIQKLTPKTQAALRKADANYAENFSPFLDSQIRKALFDDRVDASKITDMFLKPSSSRDHVEMLDKLKNAVPKDTLDLIKHRYFAKSAKSLEEMVEGGGRYKTRPDKFLSGYLNLGENQKNSLFDPEEKMKLENILTRIHLSPSSVSQKAFSSADIPTGQSLRETLESTKIPYTAGVLGNLFKSTGKAFVQLASMPLSKKFGKELAETLTNENFREDFVKKMINNEKFKPKNSKSKRIPALDILSDILRKSQIPKIKSDE